MKNLLILLTLAVFMFISCEKSTKEDKPSTTLVTTLAGSDAGFVDGAGTSAKFNEPMGIAVDNSGNLFVADAKNNAIRKITPEGVVSTFAGGSQGNTNGTGTQAQFFLPTDIVMDANGDFYVTETYGHRIRKVSASGVVSNFAGSIEGVSGYADGTGPEARFNAPTGITIGPDGNIYVAELGNYIRKITPMGVVTTFAGNGGQAQVDGTGPDASFYLPMAIDSDPSGNLFVAEYEGNAIRKVSNTGVVSTVTNFSTMYIGAPSAVAVDNTGNAYICSNSVWSVYKLTPDNKITGTAGCSSWGYKDDVGTLARFSKMFGIYVNKSGSLLYVSDDNRIRKITVTN